MGRPQAATHPMVSGSAAQPPTAMACAQLSATLDILVFPRLHLQPAASGIGQQSVAHVNPAVRTLLVQYFFQPPLCTFGFAGVMKLLDSISLIMRATRKGRVPALDATTGPVSSHIVVCNTLPLLSAKRPREPHRTVLPYAHEESPNMPLVRDPTLPRFLSMCSYLGSIQRPQDLHPSALTAAQRGLLRYQCCEASYSKREGSSTGYHYRAGQLPYSSMQQCVLTAHRAHRALVLHF
jgi:hypothetical protein